MTQFAYYANRRGFQVTDAEGNTHSLSFNIYRNRTAFTDERGQTTYYTYDGDGNVTQQLNPDRTAVSSTWQDDLKTSDTDAYGQATSYQYDANGNVTQLTDRLGNVTEYTYTDYSNPFTVTRDSDGATTHYYYYTSSFQRNTYKDQYGADTYLWEVVDANGDTTTYTYPSPNRGLPLTMTTPDGYGTNNGSYTTTYGYNDAGQMTSQVSRVDTLVWFPPRVPPYYTYATIAESWNYDVRGNLLNSTDGKGNEITYSYDFSAAC